MIEGMVRMISTKRNQARQRQQNPGWIQDCSDIPWTKRCPGSGWVPHHIHIANDQQSGDEPDQKGCNVLMLWIAVIFIHWF